MSVLVSQIRNFWSVSLHSSNIHRLRFHYYTTATTSCYSTTHNHTTTNCNNNHKNSSNNNIMKSSNTKSNGGNGGVVVTPSHIEFGQRACEYLTVATDPYHAVAESVKRLQSNSFQEIIVDSDHPYIPTTMIQPGGKYYYVLHSTTLVAFVIGEQYQPNGMNGFHIIGGHTDSPNLSLKPYSKRNGGKANTKQLSVQCYGGGLWHTWFDRDLSLSGQVYYRTNQNKKTKVTPADETKSTDGTSTSSSSSSTIESKLIQFKDPIARISTLCIHLQSDAERKGFSVDKEEHTSPIIGMATTTTTAVASETEESATTKRTVTTEEQIENIVADQVNYCDDDGSGNDDDNNTNSNDVTWRNGQEPLLLQRIARELQLPNVNDIVDYHLNLYDTQSPQLGGIHSEFIYSGRLDNLATVFVGTEAIITYANDTDYVQKDSDIKLFVAFDHEEVGSSSLNGAGSDVLKQAIKQISTALLVPSSSSSSSSLSYDEFHAGTISNSFCLSVDQAHAVHPNYSNKHENQHGPVMNGGIVIKNNANQRYATSRRTALFIRELAARRQLSQHCTPITSDTTRSTTRGIPIPIQEFVVKNDCPCGSTIGPIISTITGIRTVDIGMSQLSMHSCREVMGIVDLMYGYEFFLEYYRHYRTVQGTIKI